MPKSGRFDSILESRNAAATGILLTMPFGVLSFGTINNIPPFNGMLDPYFASDGILGALLVVFLATFLLLLPLALTVNVLAILKRPNLLSVIRYARNYVLSLQRPDSFPE